MSDSLPKYSQTLSLAALERIVITQRLRRFNGHRARTAQSLGICRNTLMEKLGQFELSTVANGRRRKGSPA